MVSFQEISLLYSPGVSMFLWIVANVRYSSVNGSANKMKLK